MEKTVLEVEKRFRVALSFPGKHRARVKRIAELLAANLGREKVLYDKWHAAEFNRLDLDVYLPKLYHDDSDLIAVFHCNTYNEREWCGLEWRACRDLIKRRTEVRLMFFRLDNAEIPGLHSIDGYQDARNMSDTEIASAILSQLGAPAASLPHRRHTVIVGFALLVLIAGFWMATVFKLRKANPSAPLNQGTTIQGAFPGRSAPSGSPSGEPLPGSPCPVGSGIASIDSPGAKISGNESRDNAGDGICVAGSRGVTVQNNKSSGNGRPLPSLPSNK